MMLIRSDAGSTGLRRIDWAMMGAIIGLLTIGTISILSAASPLANYPQILHRHFFSLALGVAGFAIGVGLNYQIFQDQSKVLYGFTLAIMVGVLLFGETIRGHKAWFRLPFLAFQPSELAKIWIVLVLSNYLDRRGNRTGRLETLLGAGAIAGPVILLILLEPDYSSAFVLCPVIFSLLFVAGADLTHLASVIGFGLIAALLPFLWTMCAMHPQWAELSRPIAYFVSLSHFNTSVLLTLVGLMALAYIAWRVAGWARVHVPWHYFAVPLLIVVAGLCASIFVNGHIKEYQRRRFMAFLNPDIDPQGATYHVNQALVAIGSGGLVGKGIFSGTQSQLGFLPERHTDFIFAVVGEEMGFLGAGAVLLLYLLLLTRMMRAAEFSRDRYGYLVCAGIGAMFGFYLLVNVGMCLGALPVAGIPLPFVSYGGSSLVVNLWAVGIVANVYSKRYAFF